MRLHPATIALAAAAAAITAGAGIAQSARDGHDRHHSTRSERQAARKAALVPQGEPVNCIQLTRIQSTEVLDDQTIDFRMRGGQVLRNTLPIACPRLGFEERFGYRTSIGQLCSVDTITVLQTGGGVPGPTCGLGEFQPMAKASAAAR